MYTSIEIICKMADKTPRTGNARVLVEPNPRVRNPRVMSMWISKNEITSSFEQDGETYYFARISRRYLTDNGIKLVDIAKRATSKEKRDVNGYLITIREIVYKRLDRLNAPHQLVKRIREFLEVLEAEAERKFFKRTGSQLKRTYQTLISSIKHLTQQDALIHEKARRLKNYEDQRQEQAERMKSRQEESLGRSKPSPVRKTSRLRRFANSVLGRLG